MIKKTEGLEKDSPSSFECKESRRERRCSSKWKRGWGSAGMSQPRAASNEIGESGRSHPAERGGRAKEVSHTIQFRVCRRALHRRKIKLGRFGKSFVYLQKGGLGTSESSV